MSIFLRWGLPALATVVGGTWLAISATAAGMHADLDARASLALAGAGYGWAEVSFDARDALVTGTVGDEAVVNLLVAELGGVRGVRSVRTDVVVAESVSPYPFTVWVEEGAVTVSGGVPDEATRTSILSRLEGATDELSVLAGAPARGVWREAIDAALAHLPFLDEGEIALRDLDLSVVGRARTLDDYEALVRLAEAPRPEGLTLTHHIVPPLASPFVWRAEFDGRAVTVSGFVPDEDILDVLRAEVGNLSPDFSLSSSVLLASGAPDNFTDVARLLLRNLLKLESGSAEISDGALSLSGAPPDAIAAIEIRAELADRGVAVDLEPPRAEAYELAITREGATIAFSGFVPDEETRERLAARPDTDLSDVTLARGAPERFESGIEFGLSLLAQMSEGTFEIHNTTLSVSGRATTADAFVALDTRLALGAPQGLILSRSDIRPPLAAPFVWSASKSGNAPVVFSGFVPTVAARDALLEAAGGPVEDGTAFADGAPEGFADDAAKALGVLALLPTGSVVYDGSGWTLGGAVSTFGDAPPVEEAFAATGLGARGWQLALDVPPPEEEPVAESYAWRADKNESGVVALSGQVPTDELRRFLAVRAGDGADDTSEVAAGAPPGFTGDALAGLEALSHLQSGSVVFENGVWSLTGTPATPADAERAAEALLTATGEGVGWSKQIAAPVVAVEPAPPPISPPVVATPEDVPVPDVQKPFIFAARKGLLEPVALEGAVPAEATRSYLGELAGGVPTENLIINNDLPDDFATRAAVGLRLLGTLHAGTFGFDGERWVLTGEVETTTERDSALSALSAIPALADVDANVSLMTPIAVCLEKVSAFADRNVILFASGSARIEESSLPALDELVGYLERCPDAAVNVEGHTDSDGDAGANLALSVARAEAVAAALIERGVPYHRLYAIGYGQTLPIADNTTTAGKRANRRIVFSFFEEGEYQVRQ